MEAVFGRGFAETCRRYSNIRADVRWLVSDAVLQEWRMRVEVRAITEDVLRDSRTWALDERHVNWDWGHIKRKLDTYGPRTLDLAFYAGYPERPQLCGIAAVQVSPHMRWVSLTHLEGAPHKHPLKGLILPLAVLGMSLFRAQVSTEDKARRMGRRILNPLPDALDCYSRNGYTDLVQEKKLSYIVIQPPVEA